MSIGQKFEKVADAVYEKGKTDIISNSKYIEKQATGKVIRLDDVSEIAHKVKVYGDNQEVEVYGKNLFDISADARLTKQADGSYINNTNIGAVVKNPLSLPDDSYVLSYDLSCPKDVNARIRVHLKDGSYVEQTQASTGGFLHYEVTIRGEVEGWSFHYAVTPKAETLFIKNVILNVGTVSEPYEPFTKQTITATPEGTEVSSICPIMNFIADNYVTINYWGSYGKYIGYLNWWRKYLNDGNPKSLYNAFGGYAWDDDTFEPPFDINATISSAIFGRTFITDVRGCMKKHNVRLICNDTNPNHNQHFSLFSDSKVKYLPYLKLPTNSSAYGWFTNCTQLIEVDGYECCEKNTFETSSGANKTFQGCTELVKIIFHGTVAKNISMQWSKKLNLESIISLFKCLKTFDTTEGSPTLTLSAETWALTETDAFKAEFDGMTGEAVCRAKCWNKA